ncbi:YczE/YyaS/YitT family protein [Candidatus Epulonipiscium viviparus]|uniref:YczE/YyaS/YitT family protein n=1 Tax=Candidatus Epulonipiscium viviparus TaxID=420336 RepID=UPI00273808BD|nr:hypothetical protein [Candidatus Epulopiscium viviparus]
MDKKARRIGMSVFGIVLVGVAVGMFKRAAFGIDPYQTFMSGLNAIIPISFGTLFTLVSVVFFVFVAVVDRRYIGITTFVNWFLLGYIIEFSHAALLSAFPEMSVLARVILLVAAIVLLCFATSFYFVSNLGVSVYDATALIMANKWKLMPFKYCRIATDLVCVMVGLACFAIANQSWSQILGAVNVGTVITAFCMGPLVDFFVKTCAKPFLERK